MGRSCQTRTLQDVLEVMQEQAEVGWKARVLSKGSFDDVLVECNQRLSDAARAFQVRFSSYFSKSRDLLSCTDEFAH